MNECLFGTVSQIFKLDLVTEKVLIFGAKYVTVFFPSVACHLFNEETVTITATTTNKKK